MSKLAALVLPHRVLVVDDDPRVVESLACLLEECGAVPLVASDGVTGVALAHCEQPDAVLVDLGMPELDGVGVGQQLAALRRGQGTRLILITGWGLEAATEAMSTGLFDALLRKPFSAAQLVAALEPPPISPRDSGERAGSPLRGAAVS